MSEKSVSTTKSLDHQVYDLDPTVTPEMRDRLLQKLKTLPASPGVYFHKSASGEVIYVGKAAVLKTL